MARTTKSSGKNKSSNKPDKKGVGGEIVEKSKPKANHKVGVGKKPDTLTHSAREYMTPDDAQFEAEFYSKRSYAELFHHHFGLLDNGDYALTVGDNRAVVRVFNGYSQGSMAQAVMVLGSDCELPTGLPILVNQVAKYDVDGFRPNLNLNQVAQAQQCEVHTFLRDAYMESSHSSEVLAIQNRRAFEKVEQAKKAFVDKAAFEEVARKQREADSAAEHFAEAKHVAFTGVTAAMQIKAQRRVSGLIRLDCDGVTAYFSTPVLKDRSVVLRLEGVDAGALEVSVGKQLKYDILSQDKCPAFASGDIACRTELHVMFGFVRAFMNANGYYKPKAEEVKPATEHFACGSFKAPELAAA